MPTPSLFPLFMRAVDGTGTTTILGASIFSVIGASNLIALVSPGLSAMIGRGTLQANITSGISAIVPSGELRAVVSSDDLSAEVN